MNQTLDNVMGCIFFGFFIGIVFASFCGARSCQRQHYAADCFAQTKDVRCWPQLEGESK